LSKHDYLIVGSGLFGAVFARKMVESGRDVLIIDRRDHIGGNVFTQEKDGVVIHRYGPHLFHTASKPIWDYVNRFAEFNSYQHRVKAVFDGKIYSLPFNLMTYHQLWGCTTPAEAKECLDRQIIPIEHPKNLEEWAVSHVGRDIYDKLIYGYTWKQWQRDPKELPASIIRRLPLRMTYNDNYYDDVYQGVPEHGYTGLVENIINDIPLKLGEDFFEIQNWRNLAHKLVYSGPIDQFFNFNHGHLEYRTLRFEDEIVEGDFQGTGQVNYTDVNVPWTRIVEHKHFRFTKSNHSVITREYSAEWTEGSIPYYPINDQKNTSTYLDYRAEAKLLDDVIIGGRLGKFSYYDMDETIASALHEADKELAAG
jgi:UDP-galactopyranose mutase